MGFGECACGHALSYVRLVLDWFDYGDMGDRNRVHGSRRVDSVSARCRCEVCGVIDEGTVIAGCVFISSTPSL